MKREMKVTEARAQTHQVIFDPVATQLFTFCSFLSFIATVTIDVFIISIIFSVEAALPSWGSPALLSNLIYKEFK